MDTDLYPGVNAESVGWKKQEINEGRSYLKVIAEMWVLVVQIRNAGPLYDLPKFPDQAPGVFLLFLPLKY